MPESGKFAKRGKNEMNKGKLQVFWDNEFLWSATLRHSPHEVLGDYVLRIYNSKGYGLYIGRFETALSAKLFLENYDPDCRWYTALGFVED